MIGQGLKIDRSIDVALDGLSGIWAWWQQEMSMILPASLRKRLGTKDTKPLTLTSTHLVGDGGEQIRATIGIVPEADILRVRKDFPKAVQANLHEAISLQIEQFVPLEREAIHFGYRRCGIDKASGQLDVEIVILEKERLETMILWADANNIPLEQINASLRGESGAEIVLWESAALAKKRSVRRINFLLTIMLLVLALGAGSVVAKRWRAVEEGWSTLVNEAQVRAVEARTLRNAIDDLKEKNLAIRNLRTTNDARSVLAVLTDVLPDGVYAKQITIIGDEFVAHVLEAKTQSLIQDDLATDKRLIDIIVQGGAPDDLAPQRILKGRFKR